jgi:FkbM family methyltransferase
MDEVTSAGPGPLRETLTESPAQVLAREAGALSSLLAAHHGRCVVFGAGTLGRRAIELLRETGVDPLGVCDSNPARWGQPLLGLTVLSPQQAAAAFGADAVFFVTIWNDFHWYAQTETKLRSLGCTSVSSYAPIFWRFGERFLNMLLLNEPPHRLYAQRDQVMEAETLWADAESLHVYRANILWRALGDARFFPLPAPQNTYFPPDLLQPVTDEVFVDCGAFDGDTLREMLSWTSGQFAAAYAIEADAVSYEKLRSYVAALPDAWQRKVYPLACAVGAARSTLRFAMSGSSTATTVDEGVEVECRTLDELFANQDELFANQDELFADRRVTMIKMDIEGAEYDALRGARAMIERDHPVLAVCVYHTQADIWRIPLLLRSMRTDYRYFLRAYDGDGLQTVLYAIPPHRMLSTAERERAVVPRKSSTL